MAGEASESLHLAKNAGQIEMPAWSQKIGTGHSRPHILRREILHIPLFGILEIDVGNATEAVTHLCPTQVVLPACRHSTGRFWTHDRTRS